jgi:hypothetical protein
LRRQRQLDDPTVLATPITADSLPRRSAASAA